MAFNPNTQTLAECIVEVQQLQRKYGFKKDVIITSKDQETVGALSQSDVTNIPTGFKKNRLPIYFKGPSTFYISKGDPGAKVPSHSHDEGDGFKVILSGSIIYNNQELKMGDWMFLPAKIKYEFEVGRDGVLMCQCYQCCC